VSLGYGQGKADADWVGQQTSIVGRKEVDIYVEDNTHIKGAIIATEKGGDLTLNTGTLTFEEIKDHDTSSEQGVSVSVSGNFAGGFDKDGSILGMKPIDYTTPPRDKDGNPVVTNRPYVPDSTEITYSSRDKEGVLRPTVTEGTIIVRDNPDTDLSGLNRDIERAREVTRDEREYVDVYISPAAIAEVLDGFKGIRNDFDALSESLTALVRKYAGAAKNLPPEHAHLGEAGLNAMNSMIENGVPQETIEKVMSDPRFQEIISDLANLDQRYKGSLDNGIASESGDNVHLYIDPETGKTVYVLDMSQKPRNIGEYTFAAVEKAYDYIASIGNETERAAVLFGIQLLMGGPVKTCVAMAKDALVDAVFGDIKKDLTNNVASYLLYGKSYDALMSELSSGSVHSRESIEASFDETFGAKVEFGLSLVGVIGGVKVKDIANSVVKNASAGLSKSAQKKLGNLNHPENCDKTVAQLIRERGGNASNVNKLETGMGERSLREVAEAASRGDSKAVEALKMIKQASVKGQRY